MMNKTCCSVDDAFGFNGGGFGGVKQSLGEKRLAVMAREQDIPG